MRQEEPATAVRDRLLAVCEEKYRAVRLRDASGKLAAEGISRGLELLRAMQTSGPSIAFLRSARQAIEAEKARQRGSAEDDEDGWHLGGLQSVMNVIDEELARAAAARRRSRIYLGIAIALVAGALLVVFVLSVSYTHIPASRLAGSDLAAAASALRIDVQDGARPPLDVHETPHGTVELAVAPNGVITAVNRKFGITIVFTPSGEGAQMQWSCRGIPAKDVPPACR